MQKGETKLICFSEWHMLGIMLFGFVGGFISVTLPISKSNNNKKKSNPDPSEGN